MTVYADILILTNFIVDYFLLAVTARITSRKPPLWRSVAAAFSAAFGTLIIFLPEQNLFSEITVRLLFSIIICLIAFGYKSIRRLLYASLTFFAVTFCYAGAMMALWYILKPSGMAIRNSVVYFDISPVFLIVFSVLGFLIFTFISTVFAKRHKRAAPCFVTLEFCGKSADFAAIIDSGNSISDPFSGGAVVITDREKCRRAFGELTAESFPQRYRAVPCVTVSGNTLLDGFRCESGRIITETKTTDLKNPVMALSAAPLCDCEAIVNPKDCD